MNPPTALVTGATSDIGAKITERLPSRGHRVLGLARRINISSATTRHVAETRYAPYAVTESVLESFNQPPSLRESLHRVHLVAADTSVLAHEEHYLLGTAVPYAQGSYGPAGMFAWTLLHLGIAAEKLFEVCARLAVWIGPVPAAGVADHLGKAMADYREHGVASLEPCLPGIDEQGTR